VIVVDTNILAGHSLRGPANRDTELLLQLNPEWAAPALWRSEFRNVLCGYLRRGVMDLDKAGEIIADAGEALKGGEHTVSDRAVLELVARSKCTAYDCEFVALAMALDVVLVTEDKDVLKAFPKQCRSLAEAIKRGVKP